MPVCRFYGTPGRGPNSHFFTLDAQECAAVQNDAGWMLESPMSFAVATPVARLSSGVITYDCGSRRRVYRLYNNRYAQNDSNHRYTSDEAVYNAMQAQGWIGEGFRFCVP
jgi:serine protease